MIRKKMIFVFFGLLITLGLTGASCMSVNDSGSSSSTTSSSESAEYYSNDAKVMEFYSDYCAWCIKEKEILTSLGKQGYRVKSMNVGIHESYWKDYNITGTPTFIAADGTRLVGYQDEAALKAFLDKNK